MLRSMPVMLMPRSQSVSPVETTRHVRPQRELIGLVADRRESRLPEELNRRPTQPFRKVELRGLRVSAEIANHQHGLILVLADESQHLSIAWILKSKAAEAEDWEALPDADQAPDPGEQRRAGALLCLHVQRLVAVDRVGDHRSVKLGAVGSRESGVSISGPLHRRSNAVAVSEVVVVSHSYLVPVVEDRGTRQAEQQAVHQLDP